MLESLLAGLETPFGGQPQRQCTKLSVSWQETGSSAPKLCPGLPVQCGKHEAGSSSSTFTSPLRHSSSCSLWGPGFLSPPYSAQPEAVKACAQGVPTSRWTWSPLMAEWDWKGLASPHFHCPLPNPNSKRGGGHKSQIRAPASEHAAWDATM